MIKVLMAFALAFIPANVLLATKEMAPQVTLEEMKKLVETKTATVIDANSAQSYETGHIPTAVSFAKQGQTLASVLPKDKNALVVAYCGGPMCTAWEEAAKQAKALGYTNIKHFKGGLQGWKEAGMKLEAAPAKKA